MKPTTIRQKLNECPFIERWFCGDPSQSGILSSGGSTTLINDKDVKLNMMVMYIPADFFKLYELQAVQGTLPGKVEAKD